MLRFIARFFNSLGLTVALLAAGLVLVFFGTLDQVEYGIYHTQQRYFESFIAIWDYPEQLPLGDKLHWLFIPMPGGYIIGPLLIINLLFAHFRYFRARWSKAGIVLIHTGVVILLVGQLATQIAQKDYMMWIDEGGTANYLENFHEDELVVVDHTAGREVRIPTDVLEQGRQDKPVVIRNPALPFRVEVIGYLPNAGLAFRQEGDTSPKLVDRGLGAELDVVVRPMPPTYAPNSRNSTTALVRLHGTEGPLGTWLVSNVFRARRGDGSVEDRYPPQMFEYQGREYELALRYEREYIPGSIKLIEFRHDRYPGTQIPKDFSSRIIVQGSEGGEERETIVYMNNPLRYGGYTFYQASFGNADRSTMFQVVRNPARWFPYIASAVISVGLLLQFILSFLKFSRRRKEREQSRTDAQIAANTTPAGADR